MELDLSKLHCGLFRCPLDVAPALMPELEPLFSYAPRYQQERAIVDVKIHMLMPGQWPCIPNWHYDFTPRDSQGIKQPEKRDRANKMHVLLSGPPYTEFRDGRTLHPWQWSEFTQFDEHRGSVSTDHCWRLFARVVPESLCPAAPATQWVRRHCQVYLDSQNFEW